MSNDFHFRPDKRSIYFTSLNDTNSPFHYLYNRSDGFKINFINNSFVSNGTFTLDTFKKYKHALEILQQGIAAESANEEAYFSNLLNDSKFADKKFNKFRNKLKIIISNKPINYIALIDLINSILLGEREYKAIVKLEKQRLDQLDSSLTQLNNRLEKEGKFSITHKALKKGNKTIVDEWTEIIGTPEELRAYLQNEYLQKHKMYTFSEDFQNVCQTVDNLASKVINNTIYTILNDDAVRTYLIDTYNNGKDIFSNNFSTFLINNILNSLWENGYLEKIILNALGEIQVNQEKIINSIILDIKSSFSKRLIQGQTSTFGQTRSKQTISYKKQQDEIQNYLIEGDGLADLILDMQAQKDINKENDYFELLDPKSKTAIALQKLKKAMTELKKEQIKKDPNEQTVNTKQKLVTQAKRDLSIAAKVAAQKKLDALENDELKEEFLQNAQNAVRSIKLYISGPTHEEIIDGIRQQFDHEIFIHTGPDDLKADSIRIRYNDIVLKTKIPKKYINKVQNSIASILDEGVQTFYTTFSKNLPQTGESTNFAQGKQAFYTAIKEGQRTIKKEKDKIINQSNEDAEALKRVALSLKDTLIVTETDKTFNTYFKDIGFVSGSLGPNITTQINNFQELFTSAGVGMTQEEAEWLEVAIVNCSPAALGSSNKGPIEQYLSTLAGFAVFDEGSAELEIITNNIKDKMVKQNSPRLLHLYKLDGLYYPGSFILSRIYEQLTTLFSNTGAQIKNVVHDGAHIRATATNHIIPKATLITENDFTEWWKTTYEIASTHYTSIDVSFLSNLFNIVSQLGEKMNLK